MEKASVALGTGFRFCSVSDSFQPAWASVYPSVHRENSLPVVASPEGSPSPLAWAPLAPIFPGHCSPQLFLVFPGKRGEILLKAFPPFHIAGIPARHPSTPPWMERRRSGRKQAVSRSPE